MSDKKETVNLYKLNLESIKVIIEGDSPLIVHKWSEKARKEMLAKQEKKASPNKRAARDPEAEWKACLYYDDDGDYGFPSTGIKQSMVRAAKSMGIAMTDARSAFHIPGELVKIKGEPKKREDMCRLATGVSSIVFRPEFKKWESTFQIVFNANIVSGEQLINMLNIAGFGTGLGDWRPQKNGNFGMFHVKA